MRQLSFFLSGINIPYASHSHRLKVSREFRVLSPGGARTAEDLSSQPRPEHGGDKAWRGGKNMGKKQAVTRP